ncbi:hypothetical protein [uncultured Methanofollis sp.]|uniref:DUF7289 family protein n=1 Tax=uncultured Methanofollis sp. TaxID=262500 RepID=UPI002617A705|nr:hypothetical protein [uncultured Methanofollis sp.]
MMKRFEIENSEGVSEAIGFILIFGLVLTGIALITLYGYPMLTQQQSNADVRNMEQTMVVLQNDIKALCFKSVPYKETALQVNGGSLAVVNATNTGERFKIEAIKIDGSANDTANIAIGKEGLTPFSPGMLVYTSDGQDATIALENGAVIRAQAGGSAMIAEPRWYTDDANGKKTLVINLVALNTTTPMARTGMGDVRLQLVPTAPPHIESFASGETVKVTYITPTDQTLDFSKAWENYLTGSLGMNEVNDKTYQMTGVNRLIIKKYEIQVLSI